MSPRKKKLKLPDSSFALSVFKSILDGGSAVYRVMDDEGKAGIGRIVGEKINFSLVIFTDKEDDIVVAGGPKGYFIVFSTYNFSLTDCDPDPHGAFPICFMNMCHWLSSVVSGGLSVLSATDEDWYWVVVIAKEDNILIGGGHQNPYVSMPHLSTGTILSSLLESPKAKREFTHVTPVKKQSARYLVIEEIEKIMGAIHDASE